MVPLAAASGDAFMAVVVLCAVLAIWWLLRAERRDAATQGEHDREPGSED